MSATAMIFWAATGLVAYTYLGYPILIGVLSRVLGRKPGAPQVDRSDLPRVSLVLAAFNEEDVIGARLRNALAMDYPRDRLEILVGCDGCTDATAAIVAGFADRGVRLLDFPENRGKASVLNDAVAQAGGELILMSDANTELDPAAARCLVRWFADPEVGVVVGRLRLVDRATGRNADGLYWRYETFLKRCEAQLGALLGANGAIYAIRRDRYEPIPAATMIDDFVIPLRSRLRHGVRILYDPDAVATEETAEGVGDEFHRRVRIGTGGYQSIPMLWRLLDPRRGWIALAFLSHKVLRWTCPFLLVAMILANIALLRQPPYGAILGLQATFYAVALLMTLVPTRSRFVRPLRLATLFAAMNAALLLGWWRWVSGRSRGTWRRTARARPEASR